MPISAMPEHLNTREEIDAAFPDDSQYGNSLFGRLYRWYNKTTKTWFAFSYRCTEKWAKWRKFPKVLFAIKGKGEWRVETEGWDSTYESRYLFNERIWAYRDIDDMLAEFKEGYLSRVQYYTRWHVAVQWPLMFSFHFYPKASDVPEYGKPRPSLKGKVWFGYWGHFDADLIYWMVTSLYFGNRWK